MGCGHGIAVPLRRTVFYPITKGVGKARRRYSFHNVSHSLRYKAYPWRSKTLSAGILLIFRKFTLHLNFKITLRRTFSHEGDTSFPAYLQAKLQSNLFNFGST